MAATTGEDASKLNANLFVPLVVLSCGFGSQCIIIIILSVVIIKITRISKLLAFYLVIIK